MTSNSNPQTGPATVLVELITERPELMRLHWTISSSGWWSGSRYDGFDARAAMAAFVAVVGGEPYEMWRPARDGEPGERRFSTILDVTWRDVHLCLSMACDAALVAESAQVAA